MQKSHPSSAYSVLLIQLLERIAYYLVRLSFVLYFISDKASGGMGWEEKSAVALCGVVYGLAHLFALVGGWITDRFWGNKKSILLGTLFSALGYLFCYFHSVGRNASLFWSLFCIEWGYGLFKPAISSLQGRCYGEVKLQREKGFSFSYLCTLLGVFWGGLLAGVLKTYYGFPAIFLTGSCFFLLTFAAALVFFSSLNEQNKRLLLPKITNTSPLFLTWQERQQSKRIGFLCFLAVLHYSTHILFNGLMNVYLYKYVDRVIMGWEIPVAWFSPFQLPFQLAMIFLLPRIWGKMAFAEKEYIVTKKVALGFLSSASAFLLMSIPAFLLFLFPLEKQSMLWLLPYYLFFIFSNICVNPVLWSSIFSFSPRRYQSLSMALIMTSLSLSGFVSTALLLLMKSLAYHSIFIVMGMAMLLFSLYLRYNTRLDRWLVTQFSSNAVKE